MLTGSLPFCAPSAPEVLTAILRDAPPPLPDAVPAWLRSTVARCLEKKASDRFSSAHDLAAVLAGAGAMRPDADAASG
jgi:serine/threonine-protein kinase